MRVVAFIEKPDPLVPADSMFQSFSVTGCSVLLWTAVGRVAGPEDASTSPQTASGTKSGGSSLPSTRTDEQGYFSLPR